MLTLTREAQTQPPGQLLYERSDQSLVWSPARQDHGLMSFGTVSVILSREGLLVGVEGYLPVSGIARNPIVTLPLVPDGVVRASGTEWLPGVAMDAPGADFDSRVTYDEASGHFAVGSPRDATVAWEFAKGCWIAVGLSGQPLCLLFRCPDLEQVLRSE